MEKGTGPGYETYQNRFVIFVSSPRQKAADEPPPNISPAAPADFRRPSPRKPVRFARSAEMRPAPEGASKTLRSLRFLPSLCPRGTCWLRGCAVLLGFGPWRGWHLVPDLCRHFRCSPTNCSLLTAHCSLVFLFRLANF